MWILRWTIVGVVMLVILGFALQNNSTVDLRIWTWESSAVPIYLVVYFSFAAGIMVAAFVAAFNQLQHKFAFRRAKNEIKQLKEELNRLHRASLDGTMLDDDAEDDEDTNTSI